MCWINEVILKEDLLSSRGSNRSNLDYTQIFCEHFGLEHKEGDQLKSPSTIEAWDGRFQNNQYYSTLLT